MDVINAYRDKIKEKELTGEATEATHYPTLELFIERIARKELGMKVRINQGSLHNFNGSYIIPDFTVKDSKKEIIGVIECKKKKESLDKKDIQAQVKRYRKFSANVILTNYDEFRLYNGNGRLCVPWDQKAPDKLTQLIVSFLLPKKSQNDGGKFTILGRNLNENQMTILENQGRVECERTSDDVGLERFCIEEYHDIPFDPDLHWMEEGKFVVAGRALTKKEMVRLRYTGSIIVNRNDTKYLIQVG